MKPVKTMQRAIKDWMSAESCKDPHSTVSSHNGSDNGLICLCQEGIWFQEIWPRTWFVHLFICFFASDREFCRFEGARARSHTDKHTYQTRGDTLIQLAKHIQPLYIGHVAKLSLSGPALLSLSQHRAVTLVSSSRTLLESQHLSRDGLTLLSDIL